MSADKIGVRSRRRIRGVNDAATIKKARACVPFATIGGFKFASLACARGLVGWARTMETELRIAVRARKNGRYSYQIFTVAGEPRPF
jgi:hypothetical protein